MSKCVNCLKEINEKEVFCLTCHEEVLECAKNQITDLEAKLAESEKKVKHWHDLYNERDKQFQSVRQRYHLLNKLQSNYDKKDKLHLAYMQCLELVEENEKLKQQLAEKEKEIEELIEELDDKNFCRDFVDLYTENRLKTQLLNENWKDKISFAIEQLEKVKSAFGLINSKLDKVETIKEYIHYIDHQIKQLKEMK